MATDLRPKSLQMPVIPSSRIVRERLIQVQAEAAKLGILLRLATELEQSTESTSDASEVDRG
ncbi:hypothetical protein FHS27_003325 [Rhodopirellula rubra]|uniref:Uncharacterized protein n=1 Tax=Aporhodopirellula rubra TaxID=980271 RepID=A0A7W5DZT3_9BACT|nr:hypothetical protein [Aporhodopirellula rubra]MBB3207500.1 hypothetical protein [Aporhodopirellula rubra]